MHEIALSSVSATEGLGARLAGVLAADCRIYLRGELGTGKTTLVRGLVRALGVSGPVRSPTYTLLEHYTTTAFDVIHLDLYRLADAEELEFLGLRDWQNAHSVWLVEWPERGKGWLPIADIMVLLRYHDGVRHALLEGFTPQGKQMIAALIE